MKDTSKILKNTDVLVYYNYNDHISITQILKHITVNWVFYRTSTGNIVKF